MTNKTLKLPPLGYDLDALEPAYSQEALEIHYKRHHQGYVNSGNDVLDAIDDARASKKMKHVRQLQKDFAFNLSGHIMHSLFWKNMSPVIGESRMPDALGHCVKECFGGTDELREHFLAAGISIQGSGWAALCWQPVTQSLVVEQILDHQDNFVVGGTPILVMDMWEHAFYLQYRNEKKRWANAFWTLVNWGDVDANLDKAKNGNPISEAA